MSPSHPSTSLPPLKPLSTLHSQNLQQLHHSPQNDLTTFQGELNTYLATEAGFRSVGGSLAIKVPKFFLAFQVARIKTAQGTAITDPGQTVEHLLGKVTKNAAGESQDLLDQVTAWASVLSCENDEGSFEVKRD